MSKQSERHVPVLLQDAIQFLNVRAGSVIADCTLGLAGHAAEIARRLGPEGKVIGFDRDPEALELAKARLDQVALELGSQAPHITLIGEAFSSIATMLNRARWMAYWPTLASVACRSTKRAEDSVLWRTDPWICAGSAIRSHRRTSGE